MDTTARDAVDPGSLLTKNSKDSRDSKDSKDLRISTGDLTIDLAAKIVCRDGEQVRLTPTEWSILELLVRNHGRLVTRAELLQHLWGSAERKDTSYLRVYLAQLRRKLECDPAHPRHFITEAGIGYRFRI